MATRCPSESIAHRIACVAVKSMAVASSTCHVFWRLPPLFLLGYLKSGEARISGSGASLVLGRSHKSEFRRKSCPHAPFGPCLNKVMTDYSPYRRARNRNSETIFSRRRLAAVEYLNGAPSLSGGLAYTRDGDMTAIRLWSNLCVLTGDTLAMDRSLGGYVWISSPIELGSEAQERPTGPQSRRVGQVIR